MAFLLLVLLSGCTHFSECLLALLGSLFCSVPRVNGHTTQAAKVSQEPSQYQSVRDTLHVPAGCVASMAMCLYVMVLRDIRRMVGSALAVRSGANRENGGLQFIFIYTGECTSCGL